MTPTDEGEQIIIDKVIYEQSKLRGQGCVMEWPVVTVVACLLVTGRMFLAFGGVVDQWEGYWVALQRDGSPSVRDGWRWLDGTAFACKQRCSDLHWHD